MDEHAQEVVMDSAIQQIMNTHIMPELEKRRQCGAQIDPGQLLAAQVLFYLDGRAPEIRINSEVKAEARCRLKPGVSKAKGDPISRSELEGVEGLALTEDEDPNCGHVTMLHFDDRWHVFFDLIYNKGVSKEYVEVAKQFLEVADHARTKQLWSAFVDNLFSAAELLAKATLLGVMDPGLRDCRKHGATHTRYNKWNHLGNVEPDCVHAFNRLSELRPAARYPGNRWSISEDEADRYLEAVRKMLGEASSLCGPRS